MKANFPVFLQKFNEGYMVHVPDLPSCVTSGKSMNEAAYMAKDALNACLLVLEDENVPLPTPTPIDELSKTSGVMVLLPVDTDAYRKASDTRAIRKSVSMPAWMAEMADKRGLSYSKILQDGLRLALAIED